MSACSAIGGGDSFQVLSHKTIGSSALEAIDATERGRIILAGAEPVRSLHDKTLEDHLEQLLADADRDIADNSISDMKTDLELMRVAYGL